MIVAAVIAAVMSFFIKEDLKRMKEQKELKVKDKINSSEASEDNDELIM
jgi:hypothetical protein